MVTDVLHVRVGLVVALFELLKCNQFFSILLKQLTVHPSRGLHDAVPHISLLLILQTQEVFLLDLVDDRLLVDAENCALVGDALDTLIVANHATLAEDVHCQREVLLQLVVLLEAVREPLLLQRVLVQQLQILLCLGDAVVKHTLVTLELARLDDVNRLCRLSFLN